MALNFPSSPSLNQEYTYGNKVWVWNGSAWNFKDILLVNLGYTGSKGDIGYTGSKGDTGYTGSKGDIGYTGSNGYTGSQGEQGSTGYTGSKGDIGYTGSAATLTAGTYVVKAVANGSVQTISQGSDQVVTFVDDIDPNGWWSSNKFQPNISGYYSISAQVWWEPGSINNNQTNIQLRKNGSSQAAIAQTPIFNTTIGYFQSISTVLYFNGTTDYVEVTAYTANPTSQNIAGSAAGTWFNAALYAYGPTGYTGSKGDTGYTGSQGDQGIQGVTGYTGSQGDQGIQGNIGYTGSQGDQGIQGNIGYTGSQGVGYTGSKGDTGYTGSQGAQGDQGIQGVTGYTGSQGDQGIQGNIGYTGSQGDQGIQGVTGYTGSQGDQGNIGYTGSQGDQGIQGVTGYTGSAGADGAAGSVGYTGSKGDIGYTGSQGDQGIQGVTGYTGSKGEDGIIGVDGAQGYTGSKGDTGYTGSQGDIGYTGSAGPTIYPGAGIPKSTGTTWDTSYSTTGTGTVVALNTSPVFNTHLELRGTGVTSFTPESFSLLSVVANENNYREVAFINQNSGSDASADFIAYNDASGVESLGSFFIDMGINSSNFSSGSYNIFPANSGYLYTAGGPDEEDPQPSHLYLGTGTLESNVVIFAGGTTTSDIKATFRADTGNLLIGTINDNGVNKLQVAGSGNFTGSLNVDGAVYSGASITQPTQLATKTYVDNQASTGFHVHEAVRVEKHGNLTATYVDGGTNPTITAIADGTTLTSAGHALVTGDVIVFDTTAYGLTAGQAYFIGTTTTDTFTLTDVDTGDTISGLTNGTGYTLTAAANTGVGATLTNAGTQAALVIGTVSMVVGDRVLVLGQTNAYENGVYEVTDIGSGSTNWELTRAADADKYGFKDPNSFGGGDYFYIQAGVPGAGESYVCTNEGVIVFGTTNITFTLFSASPQYTVLAPLNLTGTTLSLTGTVGETNGGTGQSTVTTGDLLYGSGTNTWSKLPLGVGYKSLVVNASGTQIEWNAVALNQNAAVSGQLRVVNGGTGVSTISGIVMGNGTDPFSAVTIGSGLDFTGGTLSSSVPIGYTGSQGEQGIQGPVGYTGSQGSIGYTGSAGEAGPQGPIGYTGSAGAMGYTGSQGPIGYTGSQGDVGSQGPIGYTGSQGTGYTGSMGAIGYTGSQGASGGVSVITTSSTPPTSPSVNDIWIDSNTGIQYFYINDGNSTQWVEFANVGLSGVVGYTGSAGPQGAVGYTGSAGTMTYPPVGIPVSTGSNWSSSKTTPDGDLVGTSDAQTLSNKTLSSPTISGTITFADSSTQSTAGTTASKAIAMAIVFGG